MKLCRLTIRYAMAAMASVAGAATLSAVPCRAASERVPIAAEQVSAALRAAGLPVEGAVVRMQVRMSSASAAPTLSVSAIEPWSRQPLAGERRARVRVGCLDHAECLPFYVSVEWADAVAAEAALAAAHLPSFRQAPSVPAGSLKATAMTSAPGAHEPAPGHAIWHAPGHVPGLTAEFAPGPAPEFVPAQPARAERVTSSAAGGVRAGARVTLRLEGPRIHIEVPVVCLEAGVPGHSIRVAAADHKQNYVAEVVDPTLLKGTL